MPPNEPAPTASFTDEDRAMLQLQIEWWRLTHADRSGDPRFDLSDYDLADAAEAALTRIDELEARVEALIVAVTPILSAYRSTEAHITEQQITEAWTALEEVRDR